MRSSAYLVPMASVYLPLIGAADSTLQLADFGIADRTPSSGYFDQVCGSEVSDGGQSVMNALAAVPYVRNNLEANHTLRSNAAWEMRKCLQNALARMNVGIKTPLA